MRWILASFFIGCGWLFPSRTQAEEISFRQDVMAVLSRGGCNQGTCHGNLHGKGGFKLSLRGEDPDKDFIALTRDMMGRRINGFQPKQSLLLHKASAQVPHEGGQRFPRTSPEFQILQRWLTQGAKLDPPEVALPVRLVVDPNELIVQRPASNSGPVRIRARVMYADGSRKDVSRLAVFESTNPKIEVSRDGMVGNPPGEREETTIVVRYLHLQATSLLAFVPSSPGYQWTGARSHNYIDELVFARLKKLRMNPSSLCTDSEFLRRAHIDLLGVLPTSRETREFLGDKRADKRARLVNALLERPEFADAWALKWSDLLKNEEKQLDKKGVQVFHQWIRSAMAQNKPLNQFAKELIASRGSTYKEPAANYYRALRDPYARAEATAQVFLGIRMQCAKCHNHPFNKWTQNDYYQLAAFFPRVQYKIVDNKRKDKLDKHEFIGEQIVFQDDSSEVKHPNSGQVMKPRFLGGSVLEPAAKQDRLLCLADWIADPKNPFFATIQANRIWSYLLGRGIVEPNDDFRQTNPPVNGALLNALARDLIEHRFDQKHLIRTIMNSRTYQTSAQTNDMNKNDETNFSHAEIRSLRAEPLLDAITQVTQTTLNLERYPGVKRAGQLPAMPGIRRREAQDRYFRFLRIFGKPERLLNCDCERSDNTTLAQALQLITGEVINTAIAQPDNCLGKMLKAKMSNAAIIEELFLASLCRFPSPRESAVLVKQVEESRQRREALEDVLWGLLNSKEFLLRK
ncbi:MAG TPA: DUF1549 and DUF1553 domain-containing protein [Gemmataceae bacterium]|nr:DUF1549 and DUF1553 domain-containing protein [Gemmataceae bacterium]